MLQKTLQFLLENKVFYVATVDGGKPRVRPFGLVFELDGKLYFGTANVKPVFRQLQACPSVEISATSPQMEWIRLSGKAVFDGNQAAKKKAFEVLPSLADLYMGGPDDPAFEVFYLDEAKVVFYSFATYGTEPETHCL